MSVLVTTTFSKGAIFYAGETLSCTIAFSNPLPPTSPTPSTSNSISTLSSKHTSPKLRAPGVRPAQSSHTRSQSAAIPDLPRSDATDRFSALKARSLTSLASSTIAYVSSTLSTDNQAERKETQWETQEEAKFTDDSSADAISIELDSQESSSPTFRAQAEEPSGRSSVDSLATQFALSTDRRKSQSTFNLTKKPQHLLWGYAQVVGQFVVDPTLINYNEYAPLKHCTMYQPHGAGWGGGGGSLLIAKRDQHTSTSGTLGPTSLPLNLEDIDTRTVPVFSTPPSILFVDLELVPGETKTFSYQLKLPNDLPPSHRGKAIRFNYYLVVGTQRASSMQMITDPSHGSITQARFRVMNHVSEDGSRPIYDLMNPVIHTKDEAIVRPCGPIKDKPSTQEKSVQEAQDTRRKAFADYAHELLQRHKENKESIPDFVRRESFGYDEMPTTATSRENYGPVYTSCANIVSHITNNSRSAMYDICKNNQRVAKLYLVKVAYRLGEPVIGVLDFGDAILPTHRVSIFLECKEVVEPTIALKHPQHIARLSRKTVSEFHAYCLHHRRLSFSLPIPSISSPEFQTTGVKVVYMVKFEFITNALLQGDVSTEPLYSITSADDRQNHAQAAEQVNVSTFDCQIPIRIYGAVGGSDRFVYGQPHAFHV